MYYEEKIINGILHWRGSPDDEFQPYTLKELSARYETLDKRASAFYGALTETANQLDTWAQQSRTGGWSTHQVEPQRALANELRRIAAMS